ncbi:TIGR03086 family metal-binding protein [Nocardioides jishulii]|uniref:TIGR03086 family protein n=1 Tax=Nocardioides jishulii TaxID=2575440 RepID=A0A4U2YUS7_9ACTN|nr:TIGR03086 family metal-binding protein [Nocardioides jishulii]QCX28392.1 TIGR03086 family protein [Nocardioides jishulii]TKI64715.1 TIGR03086 family protein [Nocardioides jishulii]
MLPTDIAERHREVAAVFTTLVESTTDWEAPSPVAGWSARDVVDHLTTWLPAFVHAGSPYGWTRRHQASADPLAAWREQCGAVQLLLDDPAQAESPFMHPQAPAARLDEAIDRFYVSDVFMHAWDLARATGQRAELDADFAAALLAGMRPLEEMLRASGQYGPAHPVSDDAPAIDQLMAFVGRDPEWRP